MNYPPLFYPSIDFKKSDELVWSYANDYNLRMREEHPEDHKRYTLKEQHVAVAIKLVRLLGSHVSRLKRQLLPLDTIFTYNNGLISKGKKGVCARSTVVRVIKRLEEAGIITRRKWRGHLHGIQISLNPAILRSKHDKDYTFQLIALNPTRPAAELAALAPDLAVLLPSCVAVCNHMKRHDLQDQKENHTGGSVEIGGKTSSIAEGSASADSTRLVLGEQEQGRGAEPGGEAQPGGKPPALDTRQEQRTGGAAAVPLIEGGGKAVPLPGAELMPGLPREVPEIVISAWLYAHRMLWPERRFRAEESAVACAHILAWFQRFKQKPTPKLVEEFKGRIECALKYVRKRPLERFIPRDPDWYFDMDNEAGFAGTYGWYEQTQKDKRIRRQRDANRKFLELAVLEYMQHPGLQLYRKLREQAGGRHDGDNVQRILEQLLDQFEKLNAAGNAASARKQMEPILAKALNHYRQQQYQRKAKDPLEPDQRQLLQSRLGQRPKGLKETPVDTTATRNGSTIAIGDILKNL